MKRLRRVLSALAAVWLSCQLASVSVVPIAFWLTAPDAHAVECTCVHGTDAACPMHSKPASGSKTCVMQSTTDTATVVIASLFGVEGPVSESTMPIDAAHSAALAAIVVEAMIERPTAPDPPPPRV